MTKPLSISKELVWEAYKQVKNNKGAAGIDQELYWTEFSRQIFTNFVFHFKLPLSSIL